jgi:hypothetical protein
MKIYLERPVLTVQGKPFEPPMTLRAAIFQALLAHLEDDVRLPLDEQMKIHALQKITDKPDAEGMVELTAEQVTKIKARVGKLYSIQCIGQICEMLEDGQRPAVPE